MILEKSCGAVIFTVVNGERLFLIEQMQKGHVSLCKGHVEGDETEHETACREIREETALTVEFLDGFRECIEYCPYPGCVKTVVFFLARALTREVVCQEEEVAGIKWLPIKQALAALTYESDRAILQKADAVLDAASPD